MLPGFHRERGAEYGFTLVEVVVASGLLLLLMGALISAVVAARRSVALADYRLEAMHVARRQMEQLTNLSYGVHAINAGVYTGWYEVSSNVLYPGAVRDVNITLVWNNPGSDRAATITLGGSVSEHLRDIAADN